MLKPYQIKFIDFLVKSGALTFGDFTTKSGRKTPYFVNTGNFNSGAKIGQLGGFYADHIVNLGLGRIDLIFGPAYKGIPLAVATSAALATQHQMDIGFAFNRKEAKEHGDGGVIVGGKIQDGSRLIIVEDVITAGTTLREVVPFLNSIAKVEIISVVISVDRCERGTTTLSAIKESEKELGLTVAPLVNIHEIVQYLSRENESGILLSSDQQSSIANYLKQYGA